MKNPTEQDIAEMLDASIECAEAEGYILTRATPERVNTFPNAGIPTNEKGLVLTMPDGSEFQVTVKQSKVAR